MSVLRIARGKDLTSLHKDRRSFSEDSKGSAEPVNRRYIPGLLNETGQASLSCAVCGVFSGKKLFSTLDAN